ncbi:hypothetical protein L227DRAFT_581449 [Lentinus tigrinus ALCF2SS1-6]|uniref:Uncharacterized protein n=1 Tax=Lentinus tigrinus ALCF2SS1-6 TaxID=1328759 RepID=A0A5C2RT20_9APHY|nr:hypothetical protein L227DRAFT_581449 [Lentinus tigrinus ALCF2SS1-6]
MSCCHAIHGSMQCDRPSHGAPMCSHVGVNQCPPPLMCHRFIPLSLGRSRRHRWKHAPTSDGSSFHVFHVSSVELRQASRTVEKRRLLRNDICIRFLAIRSYSNARGVHHIQCLGITKLYNSSPDTTVNTRGLRLPHHLHTEKAMIVTAATHV